MVNVGAQEVSFHFKNNIRSVEINQLLADLLEEGIYKGGGLFFVGNTVFIAVFDLLVRSTYSDIVPAPVTRDIVIKIETKSVAAIDTSTWGVTSATHALYGTFAWDEAIEQFMAFDHSLIGSVPAGAIIFGEVTFDGLGNVTAVSTVNKTQALTQEDTRNSLIAIEATANAALLLATPLTIIAHKNFDSDVAVDEVGRRGYYNGYVYYALTAGTGGAGRWGRVAIATAGF
jgi:hypothetical protein